MLYFMVFWWANERQIVLQKTVFIGNQIKDHAWLIRENLGSIYAAALLRAGSFPEQWLVIKPSESLAS